MCHRNAKDARGITVETKEAREIGKEEGREGGVGGWEGGEVFEERAIRMFLVH